MSRWSVQLLFTAGVALASFQAAAGEPAKVTVKLSDGGNGHMSLTLSQSKIKPGPVEFTVKNESHSMQHEFMIAPWSAHDGALPYDAKSQQVEEDKLKGLQGVEDLRPGETVTARFTLKSGPYVVFCNEPGHFRDAMRANLIVGDAK